MSRKGVTKLQMELRRKQLRLLLRKGFSPAELRSFAVENFHVSTRRAGEMVDAILAEVVANMAEYDHRQLAASLFDRYEYLHRMAVAKKDYATALNVLNSIAQQFLVKPPEIIITGDNGEDEDKKGDF
jgi:hypothetical protein